MVLPISCFFRWYRWLFSSYHATLARGDTVTELRTECGPQKTLRRLGALASYLALCISYLASWWKISPLSGKLCHRKASHRPIEGSLYGNVSTNQQNSPARLFWHKTWNLAYDKATEATNKIIFSKNLLTSMLLTWLHVCFSIFTLNDNLQF